MHYLILLWMSLAISGEYLLLMKKGTYPSQRVRRSFKVLDTTIYVVSSPLKRDSNTIHVEENKTFQVQGTFQSKIKGPMVNLRKRQWPMSSSFLDPIKAWSYTKGSRDIKIAILDTGVDFSHPDLTENIWKNKLEANGKVGIDDDHNGYIDDIYGYDFVHNDPNPMDDHGHGTHCAGVIGASHNHFGIHGMMAKVSLIPIKFIDRHGQGTLENALKAIDYAASVGAHLLSNSWGGDSYSVLMKKAIEKLRDRGILFVAAAGNNRSNNDFVPYYPASYSLDNVISVAAHTRFGKLATFSSYGKNSVTITAPGEKVISTIHGHDYAEYSGTSMATPFVTGVLGLLLGHHQSSKKAVETLKRSAKYSSWLRSYSISKGHLHAGAALSGTTSEYVAPKEEDWKTYTLPKTIESNHPYMSEEKFQKVVSFPGAKYVRVIIDKLDTERRWDYLEVIDPSGPVMLERLSGQLSNHYSDYAIGPKIKLVFKSDSSIEGWGVKITKIQVVRK